MVGVDIPIPGVDGFWELVILMSTERDLQESLWKDVPGGVGPGKDLAKVGEVLAKGKRSSRAV